MNSLNVSQHCKKFTVKAHLLEQNKILKVGRDSSFHPAINPFTSKATEKLFLRLQELFSF